MKAILFFTFLSSLALGCRPHKSFVEFQEYAVSEICSFESDESKRLICEGKKMVLIEYYQNQCVSSIGSVEYCMVEDVSHVAVGNEPVKRINQKVSVCYHGAFSSYHSNGVLATIGHYEHGYYKGEWRKYDENGKLLEKIRYKAHE